MMTMKPPVGLHGEHFNDFSLRSKFKTSLLNWHYRVYLHSQSLANVFITFEVAVSRIVQSAIRFREALLKSVKRGFPDRLGKLFNCTNEFAFRLQLNSWQISDVCHQDMSD